MNLVEVNNTGSRTEIGLRMKQLQNRSATYKLGFDKFSIPGNPLPHIP
jgi:hypothetical protein